MFRDLLTIIWGLTLYRLPPKIRPFRHLAFRRVESERLWGAYLKIRGWE